MDQAPPRASSPAVTDGVLYVGGSPGPANATSALYALRATTGEILWKVDDPHSTFGLGPPVLSDGRIYVRPPGPDLGPLRRP